MKARPLNLVAFFAVCFCLIANGQNKQVDKVRFFTEEKVLQATLVAPMSKVINHAAQGKNTLSARFAGNIGDTSLISEKILLDTRGHFRREYCYLPPLKITFNKKDSSYFAPLKSLKLVNVCRPGDVFSQYLLKEYLIYKIYNLISDKSLRVRLLKLDYIDSMGKKKTMSDYAFLCEDEKEMAKRNDCKVWSGGRLNTEATDRKQMTIVALFEYMIGNTDWSVPVTHNIKLIYPKADSLAKPYAVAYDFDYCGLVNTSYAIPDPLLGTETVLQRVYRGFPRTMEELNEALVVFNDQKENIYALINNFDLLSSKNKKEMTNYLDGFFNLIKKPSDVKNTFITNARTE